MKRKIYLLLSIVAISLCFHLNIKAEVDNTNGTVVNTSEEETTFDYSKMDKNYKYKEGWESYYNISDCSNVRAKNVTYKGKNTKLNIEVEVHDTKSDYINKKLDKKYYKVICDIKPGKVTATVQGINGFYGTKKVSFKINMPAIKIKSVKVKGKKINVNLNKINLKGIGYQIRYKKCTEKDFAFKKEGNQTVPGKWKNKTSKSNKITTKNLKKGNYFVQARSYIKINGKKYYGTWKAYSSLVNVKTKKASKKNYHIKALGSTFYSTNYFNKYYKKPGYGYYYQYDDLFIFEKIKGVTWTLTKRGKIIYQVTCDKKGNIIYQIKY